MSTNKPTVENSQDRTATGQTGQTVTAGRLAKTHRDYWKSRLRRRAYLDRKGRRQEIPEWQVRMFYRGKEAWFNLGMANQVTAADKARDIYLALLAGGWEVAFARFKPDPLATAAVCSVGEFLEEIEERGHLRPKTVRIYATKLRKLVSDVAKLEAGLKKKARRAKFNYLRN